MQQVTCEYVKTARGIDKAVTAEKLRRTHTVSKCTKCEKFHLWGVGSVSDLDRASAEARSAFYNQIGPNRYVLIQNKRKKKELGDED